MQDKAIFDPEKMALAEVKVLKAQVETPEFFDHTKVVGHPLDFSLKLGFSLEERLAKADFSIQIKTDSKGENEEEAQGEFQLVFIYKIENLDELVVLEKNKQPKLNPGLATALSSVSYSTSRGILLTRLQGTALQNFMLPIINPTKLLQKG